MGTLLGLADWHMYEIGPGYTTALMQTPSKLYFIIVGPSGVEWRRYADKHGMVLEANGTALSLSDAQVRARQENTNYGQSI